MGSDDGNLADALAASQCRRLPSELVCIDFHSHSLVSEGSLTFSGIWGAGGSPGDGDQEMGIASFSHSHSLETPQGVGEFPPP